MKQIRRWESIEKGLWTWGSSALCWRFASSTVPMMNAQGQLYPLMSWPVSSSISDLTFAKQRQTQSENHTLAFSCTPWMQLQILKELNTKKWSWVRWLQFAPFRWRFSDSMYNLIIYPALSEVTPWVCEGWLTMTFKSMSFHYSRRQLTTSLNILNYCWGACILTPLWLGWTAVFSFVFKITVHHTKRI